jgi:CheY-like chemotaxis protein
MKKESKVILYVDDDADDREFLFSAIHELSPETEVVLAENGITALNYLNAITDKALPCLVVLDLNMPFLDGRETYERMQEKPALQGIPTVVFTSSQNPNDKDLFNRFGVELISKPDNLGYLSGIASRMLEKCYC